VDIRPDRPGILDLLFSSAAEHRGSHTDPFAAKGLSR
jgi:hypothetical protein